MRCSAVDDKLQEFPSKCTIQRGSIEIICLWNIITGCIHTSFRSCYTWVSCHCENYLIPNTSTWIHAVSQNNWCRRLSSQSDLNISSLDSTASRSRLKDACAGCGTNPGNKPFICTCGSISRCLLGGPSWADKFEETKGRITSLMLCNTCRKRSSTLKQERTWRSRTWKVKLIMEWGLKEAVVHTANQ